MKVISGRAVFVDDRCVNNSQYCNVFGAILPAIFISLPMTCLSNYTITMMTYDACIYLVKFMHADIMQFAYIPTGSLCS